MVDCDFVVEIVASQTGARPQAILLRNFKIWQFTVTSFCFAGVSGLITRLEIPESRSATSAPMYLIET